MKIAILVEGATEVAFKEKLNEFLKSHLNQKMPKLVFIVQDGRIPKEEKLKRLVENLLTGNNAYDAVIALTDVYTGTKDFQSAADAKAKMKQWVGTIPNSVHIMLYMILRLGYFHTGAQSKKGQNTIARLQMVLLKR
jgi:hypothetical protein